jgi:hypothetical protein
VNGVAENVVQEERVNAVHIHTEWTPRSGPQGDRWRITGLLGRHRARGFPHNAALRHISATAFSGSFTTTWPSHRIRPITAADREREVLRQAGVDLGRALVVGQHSQSNRRGQRPRPAGVTLGTFTRLVPHTSDDVDDAPSI